MTPQEIVVSKSGLMKRHFSFSANEQSIATLDYENVSSTKAKVTIRDKHWDLQRKGFWQRELTIIAQESPYTKTKIRFGWRNKFSLRAEDNNMYHFKPIGFWQRTYGWFDDAGEKLLEMKSNHFSRKRRGIITIFQPQKQIVYWLMVLGWFQLVAYEDAAAVAATS